MSFDHNFGIFEVFLTLYNFPYKAQEVSQSIQTFATLINALGISKELWVIPGVQ